MKANEAPKKLYVNFHFIETHPASNQPLVTKQGVNKYDIEYTRTDAFIKKACDVYCKVCGHYPHTTPNHICRQVCDYYKDFKKYIEG